MKKVSIDISNDGKGKYQSFECLLTVGEEPETVYYYGYGADEDEAKDECLEKFNKELDGLLEVKDSLNLDRKLEKSGVKSYINRVNDIFSDSSERFNIINNIMLANGYECVSPYNIFNSPFARFKKGGGIGKIDVIIGCIRQKDVLNINLSGLNILRIEDYDFTDISKFEQLIRGMFFDPRIKSINNDGEED